jgi:hypothetical protein
LLFQRPDGYFGLVEQYWYDNVYEGRNVSTIVRQSSVEFKL